LLCSTLRAVFQLSIKNGYISSLPHFPTFRVDQYGREGPSLDEEDGVRIGRIQVLAMEKGARRTKKPRAFKVHDKVNHLLEGRRNHLDCADDNDYIFTHPLFSRENLRRRNIGNLRNTYTKAMDAHDLRYDGRITNPNCTSQGIPTRLYHVMLASLLMIYLMILVIGLQPLKGSISGEIQVREKGFR